MEVEDSVPIRSRRFCTTRWTVVLAAVNRHDTAGRQALDTLCRSYWYPLYAFARRKGHSVEGARFDPNTRPDSYCAANILLRNLDLDEGETRDLHVFDWDSSGEALVDYRIQIKHAGKEQIQVPAGTFEANHLMLTQITSADTWFKKRAGHLTEFWILDNNVIVRVLRHREPYEMVLLDHTFPR